MGSNGVVPKGEKHIHPPSAWSQYPVFIRVRLLICGYTGIVVVVMVGVRVRVTELKYVVLSRFIELLGHLGGACACSKKQAASKQQLAPGGPQSNRGP